MTAYIATLTNLEKVFLVSALLGTLLIIVNTIWLVLVSGFCQKEEDTHNQERQGVKTNQGFQDKRSQIFQAGVGFVLMFGVVGLALTRLTEAADAWSLVGGLAAGSLTVRLIFEFGSDEEINDKKVFN